MPKKPNSSRTLNSRLRYRRAFLEQLEDRRLLAGNIPTLDPISDLVIDEDAPAQTVELSGITAGIGRGPGVITKIELDPGSAGSDPVSFQQLTPELVLFAATTEASGRELWKTDGTQAGTSMLKDLRPGSDSSHPHALTLVGDSVFFVANNSEDVAQVWVSDGTEAGTQMLTNFTGHLDPPRSFTALGDRLMFKTNTQSQGTELWTSDGTPEGTVMVKDLIPGSFGSNPEWMVVWNDKLYFRAQPGAGQPTTLWESDGTEGGTVNLAVPAWELLKFDHGVIAEDSDTLRYFNGTETVVIATPGITAIEGMVAAGPKVYVGANNSDHGREVYQINFESNSLELVKDIRPGSGSGLPAAARRKIAESWKKEGAPA